MTVVIVEMKMRRELNVWSELKMFFTAIDVTS